MSAVREDEKSLGQLFSELADETRSLVRQEIALAKTEVTEKAVFAGKNAGLAAAGGLVLLVGVLPILAGIIIALGHKIGYATSSFIVGILFVAIGAFLVTKALNAFKKHSLAPVQTATQVKETTQWMKQQVRG
jgi:hypothetical protein